MRQVDIRNACFRARNGIFRENQAHYIEAVKEVMPAWAEWAGFSTEWDILVKKDKTLMFYVPVMDLNVYNKLCLKVQMSVSHSIPFELSPTEQNLYNIIEQEMLEGIHRWEDYDTKWSVALDHDTKRIKIITHNVPRGQDEIAVPNAPTSTAYTGENELPEVKIDNFEPMKENEVALFERFFKKKTFKPSDK